MSEEVRVQDRDRPLALEDQSQEYREAYQAHVLARAKLFQSLANPVRLCILQKLSHYDELCVSDFCACMDASQPLISKHLRNLKDEGILESETRGQFSWYSLVDEDVRTILGALEEGPEEEEK